MYDKFIFSNSQALATLDSTGVISSNYLDMEYDDSNVLIKADQMVECWLNVLIVATTNTGGDEGMMFQLIASDATAGTSPEYLGIIRLLQAEIVAGYKFSIGVSKKCTKRYLSVWNIAVNTSLNGATAVDSQISVAPWSSPNKRIQQKPA